MRDRDESSRDETIERVGAMTDVPGDDTPGKDRESSDEFLECATCGERFDPSVWHPATTTVGDDGEFQLLAFCSAECRDDWVTG